MRRVLAAARARSAYLALAIGLTACSVKEREVRLQFAGDSELPHGFHCRLDDDPDRRLITRILDNDPPVASLLVDFIGLGGVPGCRASQLLAWCSEHDCSPVERRCIDLPLAGGDSLAERLRESARALEGHPVLDDAPDDPVLIRVTGVARSCDDILALSAASSDVPCEALIGCAYSCPVLLDQVEGDVVVDLDALGDRCEPEVKVCASTPLGRTPTCSP